MLSENELDAARLFSALPLTTKRAIDGGARVWRVNPPHLNQDL